ncbi:hypothetical protein BX666DRAFT_2109855 [Dichotomocladium elegans]|nr:hypothetical protein BX666DRAFT_2109855 [Dichotomocladium elegans]
MSNRSGHAAMPSLSSSISSCSSTSTSSIKPPVKIRKPSKQVSFLEQPIVIYDAGAPQYSASSAFLDYGLPRQTSLGSVEDHDAENTSAWWNLAVDLADDGPAEQENEPWYRPKKLFGRPSWLKLISAPVLPSLQCYVEHSTYRRELA